MRDIESARKREEQAEEDRRLREWVFNSPSYLREYAEVILRVADQNVGFKEPSFLEAWAEWYLATNPQSDDEPVEEIDQQDQDSPYEEPGDESPSDRQGRLIY